MIFRQRAPNRAENRRKPDDSFEPNSIIKFVVFSREDEELFFHFFFRKLVVSTTLFVSGALVIVHFVYVTAVALRPSLCINR